MIFHGDLAHWRHHSTLPLSSLILLVVHVIHEWNNVLVPSWDVALSFLSDQVSQQSDVLDLLLLKLEVGVVDSEMELLFEGHGESPDRLFKHNLVNGLACGLRLVLLVGIGDLEEHVVVLGALQGLDEGLEVLGLIDILKSFWVKISNLTDVLLPLRVTSSVNQARVQSRVLNNLDGLQVRLELEEVGHDTL